MWRAVPCSASAAVRRAWSTPGSVPMEEARARFVEAAQLIRLALSEPEFEWQGEYYQIPRTSIRPRPLSNPERRFLSSGHARVSRDHGEARFRHDGDHAERMAEGRGRIDRFREIAAAVGHVPPPPLILNNVSCAESRDEAHERAMRISGGNGIPLIITIISRTAIWRR